MLTFISFHSQGRIDVLTLILRFSSSGSKSEAVLPSSTRPSRLIAPASNSMASASEVFPVPPWPTMATLRMERVSYSFITGQTLSSFTCLGERSGVAERTAEPRRCGGLAALHCHRRWPRSYRSGRLRAAVNAWQRRASQSAAPGLPELAVLIGGIGHSHGGRVVGAGGVGSMVVGVVPSAFECATAWVSER